MNIGKTGLLYIVAVYCTVKWISGQVKTFTGKSARDCIRYISSDSGISDYYIIMYNSSKDQETSSRRLTGRNEGCAVHTVLVAEMNQINEFHDNEIKKMKTWVRELSLVSVRLVGVIMGRLVYITLHDSQPP